MGLTITVHLSEAGQRAAAAAGQPAAAKQTYHTEGLELVRRALAQPWPDPSHPHLAVVRPDGEAELSLPSRWNFGGDVAVLEFDARPADAAAALDAISSTLTIAEGQLREERERREQRERERQRSDRADAEAWAALPLEWRVSGTGGVATCAPLDAGPDYRGQLVETGRQLVAVGTLRRYVPDALAGAEAAAREVRTRLQAEESARKAAAIADRAAWIAEHGSERLRLALSLGQEAAVHKSYLGERLAMELPGWRFSSAASDIDMEEDPREPTMEALRALRDAHTAGLQRAVELVWLTSEEQVERGEDGCRTGDVIAATGCEALAATWQGRRIVLEIEGGRSR